VLIEKKDAAGNVTREPVPAERPITVQDLLRHTSGFAYADNAPFPEIKDAYDKADIDSLETDVSPDALVQRLASIPLAWQPGTRWQYGVSTDVLGVLLERLTGKRLDFLLEEMLFTPLEMKDTRFQVKPEQMARLADAFDADPLKARGWKSTRVEADPGMRYRKGGGGTVSTAADYFRFAQMLLNGALDWVRCLSRKTVEYMLADHVPGFPGTTTNVGILGYGFGLGFAVRRQDGFAVVPGSTGDAWWAGFGGTSFIIDPKEQLVGVFLAQAPTSRQHIRLLFKNLLYGALMQ
jgi:CubicO group peptidase (beta-lactamase class C family)